MKMYTKRGPYTNKIYHSYGPKRLCEPRVCGALYRYMYNGTIEGITIEMKPMT